jgi:hypothetical protein
MATVESAPQVRGAALDRPGAAAAPLAMETTELAFADAVLEAGGAT